MGSTEKLIELSKKDSKLIHQILINEIDQVSTLVLAYLPSEKSSEILMLFSSEKRNILLENIKNLKNYSLDTLELIEQILLNEIDIIDSSEFETINGENRYFEIVSLLTKEQK